MIRISEYSEDWPRAFEELQERLSEGLSGLDVTVQHVGSTAVPGLASKPILDIHVSVGAGSEMETVIDRLAALGYMREGEVGVMGREAFRRKGPDVPFRDPKRDWFPHHLFASPGSDGEIVRHLAFRDHLRATDEDRNAYGTLKRRIASEHPDDPDAYGMGKREFIEGILAKLAEGDSTESEGSRER
jgi:GrpB-like predicted nucleotidyltransferase (UPF0157 family)